MHGPNPQTLYPLAGFPRAVFLKNFITRKNIEVGDYTYYDDPDGAERFEERNILYHHEFYGDRLIIGRFTALASGVTFLMNGANHAMDGFSTYPFNIFANGWENGFDTASWTEASRGDTVVGNDVWIGRNATIVPGVTIGDGAIIAANALIASDVPAYATVGGNPARLISNRFDDRTRERLLEITWWHWPAEHLARHLNAVRGYDLAALERAAEELES